MATLMSTATAIARDSTLDPDVKKAVMWVINHIDMQKLVERVEQALLSDTLTTRCVLLEYNYTPWNDVSSGMHDMSDRLPGTDKLVHSVINSMEFKNAMYTYIIGNDPRIVAYTRWKVQANGSYHPYKRQLVLVFSKELPQTPPMSEVCTEDCC